MARTASPLTIAIRSLLDKNPELTHLEARPMLAKMGITVVADPPASNENTDLFQSYQYDLKDSESVAAVVAACGFSRNVAKKVVDEVRAIDAFHSERNHFDVTKSLYKNATSSGKSRKAPKTGKPSKNGNMSSLQLVQKYGGIAAVRSLIKNLTAACDEVESLRSQLDKAA